jgi:hypothetical protein
MLETTQSVVSYYCRLVKPPRRRILGIMSERLGVSVTELVGDSPLDAQARISPKPKTSPKAGSPHIVAMEDLKERWKKKPKEREAIRHLLAMLFPKDADHLLAWLDEP